MTRTSSRTRRGSVPLKFDEKLLLNQWALRQFGVSSFQDLADRIKHGDEDGLDENGNHYFLYPLFSLPGLGFLSKELLLQYDRNIVRHTRHISERRNSPVRWKYFQWLTLLFTELYLDRFFQDADGLLAELNAFREEHNEGRPRRDQVSAYTLDDLRKIAFWNATGSGKTLLMHVNILQYLHYLERYGSSSDLNRIILLTPNEGLSEQHLIELHKSSIYAELFQKDGGELFSRTTVQILDVHKLRDDAGEKTVAIDSFEGNNFVLVDEAHRGSSTDIGRWMRARDRLCEQGFSMEYSATFGQAVGKSGELHDRYVKCILFDYSYKYFYNDGFGKDYRILNLADDSDEQQRDMYLTACLMSFYQQRKLYMDKHEEFKSYLLEDPLLVFVGNTVNAVRTVRGRKVSDVLDVLLFFDRFVRNRRKTANTIERLLKGRGGLLNQQGRDIFSTAFSYLVSINMTAEAIFDDMLKVLFNANSPGALHVEELKGADGEISLKLGDNDPFGLINVGDAPTFRRLCEGAAELVVNEKTFSESLFSTINRKDSPINVLIGSKRFTEGWNSWRVSTMGFLNIGRSAGPEIIQLFGRGVRLKGKNMSLKRSSHLGHSRPQHIELLETLNIFGVRAQYMDQFRDYLEEEDVAANDEDPYVITVPTVKNSGDTPLKIIRLQDGIDFKKDGPKPLFGTIPERFRNHPIELNWYPMIHMRQSREARATDDAIELDEGYFIEKHVAFMDVQRIWEQLQQFKNEKNFYDYNLPIDAIPTLLTDKSWYVLKIPREELEFTSFSQVRRWEDVAIALLCRYMERIYKYEQTRFERNYLEYQALDSEDANFVHEYRFEVYDPSGSYTSWLEQLRDVIMKGQFTEDQEQGNIQAIHFDRHLYQPLLSVSGELVRVKPVALNEGEQAFVRDLRAFCESYPSYFEGKSIHLLRNMSRGRGLGFFIEGNFYPDFILWILIGDKQYITFVDPKGLTYTRGPDDPKIRFHKIIKEEEKRLGDPNVVLNSFIISVTPWQQLKWWDGGMAIEDFMDTNVIFQQSGDIGYIRSLFQKVMNDDEYI